MGKEKDIVYEFLRASQAAEQKQRRRTVIIFTTVITLTMVAFVLLILIRQERNTTQEEARQNRRSFSSKLAENAKSTLKEYPQRSLLLAIEALDVTRGENEPRVPAAEQALRDALANTGGVGLHNYNDKNINIQAISPDSHWLVISSGNTAQLWDLAKFDSDIEPIEPRDLQSHKEPISAIAISNHWLVTASSDGSAYLWDLTASNAQPLALQNHEEAIKVVAISPNNQWLVTAGDDNTASVSKLTAEGPSFWQELTYEGGESRSHVAFSPDNHWLVTADGQAHLWDLTVSEPSPRSIPLKGHEAGLDAVTISNHWLVTGSQDGSVRLWDLTTDNLSLEEPTLLEGHKKAIRTLTISPDNRWLVTKSHGDSGTAKLWDLTSEEVSLQQPFTITSLSGSRWDITISTDSHWLVSGNNDGSGRLWNLRALEGDPFHLPSRDEFIFFSTTISPDNHWLATHSGGSDSSVYLWDLTGIESSVEPIILKGHEESIWEVTISPNSHWLVSSTRPLGSDSPSNGATRLWDLRNRLFAAQPIYLTGHERQTEANSNVAFTSADKRWLVTHCQNNHVCLWDLSNLDAEPLTLTYKSHDLLPIAISPDRRWLLTSNGEPSLWDLTEPNPQPTSLMNDYFIDENSRPIRPNPSDLPLFFGPIMAIAFTPDSDRLATAHWGGSVYLWDLTVDDQFLRKPLPYSDDKEQVAAMAISPDNHWLVTGRQDGSVQLWDLTRPDAKPFDLQAHDEAVKAVAFSRDNHWLVTGSTTITSVQVHRWDLTVNDPSAQEPLSLTANNPSGQQLVIPFEPKGSIMDISPDNQRLAFIYDDKNIYIFDLNNPDDGPIRLSPDKGQIKALSFTFDNNQLVTANDNGSVQVWELRMEKLIDLACRTVGRNLSQAEWKQYMDNQRYRETC